MQGHQIYDYRNGKFQGVIKNGQRHGIGILIDDDLSFYVSNWFHNQLNALTLVYKGHAKYIYGEWKNNTPHGLNIFRSGDTVLLGCFNWGKLIGRCLVIFERFNFAIVLESSSLDFGIVKSGNLLNHQVLMSYVDLTGLNVPDHFFSLTKFVHFISSKTSIVRARPCRQNYCYFGFNEGLAIIFNSNNAMVSIGVHRNELLAEMGGKFQNRRIEEGNFEIGCEKIIYCGQRPKDKIYSIFQKIHKRSLLFINQYFDGRVKILHQLQNLLRGKIRELGERRGQISITDLNDSLDFQQYVEQESQKLNMIREMMYENKRKIKQVSTKTNERVKTQTIDYKFESNTSTKLKQVIQKQNNVEEVKSIYSTTKSPMKQKGNFETEAIKQEIKKMQTKNGLYIKGYQAKQQEKSPLKKGNSIYKQREVKGPSTFKGLIEKMDFQKKQKISEINTKVDVSTRTNCNIKDRNENNKPYKAVQKQNRFDYKEEKKYLSYEDIEMRRNKLMNQFGQKPNIQYKQKVDKLGGRRYQYVFD